MNSKEQYIKMRNVEKLDNNFLWNYYREQGGKLTDPQEFLNRFYYTEQIINFNGQQIVQKINRDLNSFFEDMDRKFQLQTLWDVDGKFIKVVE